MNGWDALVVSVFLVCALVMCLAAVFCDEIVARIRGDRDLDGLGVWVDDDEEVGG